MLTQKQYNKKILLEISIKQETQQCFSLHIFSYKQPGCEGYRPQFRKKLSKLLRNHESLNY